MGDGERISFVFMVQIPGEMERERFSNLSKERALRGYAESPRRETGRGRYQG